MLNFHHYADKCYATGNLGVSPEEDQLQAQLKRLDLIGDKFFAGKEIWLSEFGYNTFPDFSSPPYTGPGFCQAIHI